MWKGRFDNDTAKAGIELSKSPDCDWELAEFDIIARIAHAIMLNKIGIIDDKEFIEIESGLISVKDDILTGRFIQKTEYNDVHSNVEARLIEKIGAAGAKLHTELNRNDQITTTLKLYMRAQLFEIKNIMVSVLECLLERAESHYSLIVPGYNYLRQAQTINIGHYWLAHYDAFSRDLIRLIAAFNSTNECTLGVSELTWPTQKYDRELVYKILGFSTTANNYLDTLMSSDYIADYHHFATLFSIHTNRLAEDFAIYSSQEFGWLIMNSATYTSNPVELLRGKTGQIIGNAHDLLTNIKGIPIIDIQEAKCGLLGSINTVKLMLSILQPLISSALIDEKLARKPLEKDIVLPQVSLSRTKLEEMKNAIDFDVNRHKYQFSAASKMDSDFTNVNVMSRISENISLFEGSVDESFIGYFDGASRGNPGLAGAGAWISCGNKEPVWENSDVLGKKTNNEAEYIALINLLNEFRKCGIKKAIVRGDSKLVIEQMSGRWKVNEPRLKELCKQAKLLAQDMHLVYEWIPREQNSYADYLSNKAIDKY
ncbi:MAG: lyase family protein [Synergistaceae bacterium]|nr:lyase family protein [Synergistaceae bacterium]